MWHTCYLKLLAPSSGKYFDAYRLHFRYLQKFSKYGDDSNFRNSKWVASQFCFKIISYWTTWTFQNKDSESNSYVNKLQNIGNVRRPHCKHAVNFASHSSICLLGGHTFQITNSTPFVLNQQSVHLLRFTTRKKNKVGSIYWFW